MMVREKAWNAYTDLLRRTSDTAARKFTAYLERLGDWQSEAVRIEIINYAFALATSYGEASASLACDMYDALAEAQGAMLPPADPAPTATYQETAAAVQGAMKQSQTTEVVSGVVDRLVKQAGADTTLRNAARDGAEFAWIPVGDTCAFCIALASNGWQRVSKNALKHGHAEHIHPHCDCQYAVRFDDFSTVAGYDPDRYRDMYYGAELRPGEKPTADNRVNAMRREFYAENRDRINEQKRDAYARRKELESSAAEEIKI